jgi:hypothetical protein
LAIVLVIALAIALRGTMADLFVKTVWFPIRTIGAFAAAFLTIGNTFAADRLLCLRHAIATPQVFVSVPAPRPTASSPIVIWPIVIAQVQS